MASKCRVVGCSNKSRTYFMCHSCYSSVRRLVAKGYLTDISYKGIRVVEGIGGRRVFLWHQIS